MSGLIKIMVATIVVITICCTLAVLFAPHHLANGRRERAQRVVDNVVQATWNYHADQHEFPLGDGNGSNFLVRALEDPKRPYFTFVPDMLTRQRDIRSPIDPDHEIVHYRNNSTCAGSLRSDPSYHNTQSFDLWCRDDEGRAEGINNWE